MKSKFEAKNTELKKELAQQEKDIASLSSEVARLEGEIAKADTKPVLSQNKDLIIKARNEIKQLTREILRVLFPQDSIADAPVFNSFAAPEAPTPSAPPPPDAAETTVHKAAIAPSVKKVVVDEKKFAKQDEAEARREIEAEMAVEAKNAAATAALQRAQMAAAATAAKKMASNDDDDDDDWGEENVAAEAPTQTVQSPQTPEQIAQEKEQRIAQRIKDKQKARINEQGQEKELAQREITIDKNQTKIKNLQEKIEGLLSDLTIKTGNKDVYAEAIKSQNDLISDLNKKKELLSAKKDSIVKTIDVALAAQQQLDAAGNEPENEQAAVSEVPAAPAAPSAPDDLPDVPIKSVAATPASQQSSSTKKNEIDMSQIMKGRRARVEEDDEPEVGTPEVAKQDNRHQEKLLELGVTLKAVDPKVLEKAKQEALQEKTSVLDAVGQARSATQHIDAFIAGTDSLVDSVLADIQKNAAEEREAAALIAQIEESQRSADLALQKAKDEIPALVEQRTAQEALVAAAENADQQLEATPEKVEAVVDSSQKTTTATAKTEPAPEPIINEVRRRFEQAEQKSKAEKVNGKVSERDSYKAQWAKKKESEAKVQEQNPVDPPQPATQKVIEAEAPLQNKVEHETREQLLKDANIYNRLLRIGNEAISFDFKAREAYAAGDTKSELDFARSCGHARILHATLESYTTDFLKGKGDIKTDLAAFIDKCELSLKSEEARKLEVHVGAWSTIKNTIYDIGKAIKEAFSSNKSEAKTITYEEPVIGSTDSMKRIVEMKNSLIDLKKEHLSKDADLGEHKSLKP